MDDAEYEIQKQRLLRLNDVWIDPLGLGWWDIVMTYARDDYVAPQNASSPDASLAKCTANWRYGHAAIEWNMPPSSGTCRGCVRSGIRSSSAALCTS